MTTPQYVFTIYFWLQMVTAVITLIVFAYAWPRRQVVGARILALMMLVIAFWAMSAGLEAAAVQTELKYFWTSLEYVGSCSAIALFLMFSLEYTRQHQWFTQRRLALLWALPIIFILLAQTNRWHWLMWQGAEAGAPGSNLIVYQHGPAYWFMLSMVYAYVTIGSFLLAQASRRGDLLSRQQGLALLVAAVFPFVGSVVYVFDLSPISGLNVIPLTFSLTGIMGLVTLSRYRLFELVPVGREQLVERMTTGLLVLNMDFIILDINPALAQLLALGDEMVVGHDVARILPEARELVAAYQPEGPVVDVVLQRRSCCVAVTVVALNGRTGVQRGWLLIVTDVTAQQQAEQALRELNSTLEAKVAAQVQEIEEEKQTLEAVLQSAGDAIILIDAALVIVFANEAFSQFTGYDGVEAVGQPLSILSVQWREQEMTAILTKIGRQDPLWQGDVTMQRKDGRIYDANLIITPLNRATHNTRGWVATFRDIRHQRELERARVSFMQNVSHQLRTPLTNLKLYTDLLARGNPEKKAKYLQALAEQSDRLEYLVQGILQLVSLDSGQAVHTWHGVALLPLLQQVVRLFEPAAAEAGMALIFEDGNEDIPLVQGDAYLIQQAITELVKNALTFTPVDERVVVSMDTAVADNAQWVRIHIQDSGPGVTADEQRRIFERFYRGEMAASGHIPGVGLGLSIVEAIMQAHGGRVTVVSKVGEGSLFSLWLRPYHPVTAVDG